MGLEQSELVEKVSSWTLCAETAEARTAATATAKKAFIFWRIISRKKNACAPIRDLGMLFQFLFFP